MTTAGATTTKRKSPNTTSSSKKRKVSTSRRKNDTTKTPDPTKKKVKQTSPVPPGAASTTTPKSSDAAVTITTQAPPAHILILDNGGDTIKYGWSTDTAPKYFPNVTARLQQQWTVLVGDQLSQIQNPNQLIGVTRSTERGMITNLGNQIQVWKRILDLLHVTVPTHHATAQALGWMAATTASSKKQPKKKAATTTTTPATDSAAAMTLIPSSTCAVLIALPPFCPRTILDQIVTIWMEDFGFEAVGFCISSGTTHQRLLHPEYQTCCLVDLGWSGTHVVPVFENTVIDPGTTIRRLPAGGRHLINLWKYYTSYRQWNLMDSEWLLRQVLEQSGYVSMQFTADMKLALHKPAGRRPYDREFVLPDFQTTFQGKLQLPPALLKEMAAKESKESGGAVGGGGEDEEESEEDEDVKEEDLSDGNDEEDDVENNNNNNEDEDSVDDEEETLEQAKQRLKQQREAEERKRRELEAEQQVLNISVERFAIPEVLFRPGDAGLPLEWASLPEAIVQSITACPAHFQPALFLSIRLVGGLSGLENLKERLEMELRALTPCAYDLNIQMSDAALDEAWLGACQFANSNPYTKWSISRREWEAAGKKGALGRLFASEGGAII